MIFPVERTISAISSVMSLERYDLILTGTPAGVGPMIKGDILKAGIEGIGEATFMVDQM
jgi:2-keto-4-pentenoate hydratase/2-oxohepta-3-ene-1,7-dioic acid hydratase in catechol pathway